MAAALAESACAVIERMEFAPADAVDWRAISLELPLKPPDAARVAEAERMLRQHPRPLWRQDPPQVDPDWFRAASVMSVELMRRRSPTLGYEIQVFRVGDAAVVGLPGEPFVEGQLTIKVASPASHVFVAHAATQYVGYVPTREAFAHGGHEVDFSYWAKLTPDALDAIVRRTRQEVADLFR
jgi:hypothetical protein